MLLKVRPTLLPYSLFGFLGAHVSPQGLRKKGLRCLFCKLFLMTAATADADALANDGQVFSLKLKICCLLWNSRKVLQIVENVLVRWGVAGDLGCR